MKVAIRTAGKKGEDLERIITDLYEEAQVTAFVDSSVQKIGESLREIPIISLSGLSVLYRQGEIEKVIIPCEFYEIYFSDWHMIEQFCHELKAYGIDEKDILIANYITKNWTKEKKRDFKLDFVEYDQFYHLRYLEIPLAFHCNLNCKSCSHFSPLVEREFPEFEQVERDFNQLKKFIPHIHRIRMLGGEPLLNKELNRYIKLVKGIYPDSDLRIVTNGLLLKQLREDEIACIREHDVTVDLSAYPVLRKNCDQILQWLNQRHIKSQLFDTYEFAPTFKEKRGKYPFKTTDRTCLYAYMTEGTISTCILMHDTKYYNQYFEENLPAAEGMIDLYDPKLTSRRLLDKLKRPYPLCDYCEMYKHMSPELSKLFYQDIDVEWGLYSSQNPPCKEDWIYKGE